MLKIDWIATLASLTRNDVELFLPANSYKLQANFSLPCLSPSATLSHNLPNKHLDAKSENHPVESILGFIESHRTGETSGQASFL